MDGAMNFNMTDNYKECLQKGLEFQDYVSQVLMNELGISLTTYNSIKYQIIKGENRQGFEIKFDDKFKETSNLYIEVKEKAKAENKYYVDSGIYRNDNTWLYIIGDYTQLFIFGKNHLQLMDRTNKYRKVRTPTSIGFLLPYTDAVKYSLKTIYNKDKE
jgi:hypothetical protein